MSSEHRVLVVDDENSVIVSCRRILERSDIEVLAANSADEAMKVLAEEKVSVVLTDLMMPGADGLTLTRWIKAKWPNVSVIMITGYATIKTAVEAIREGAFDFIPKPFESDELTSVVSRALQRAKLDVDAPTATSPTPSPAPAAPRPDPLPAPASDVYCVREICWARCDDDGLVTVGVHPIYAKTIGSVASIDLPLQDDSIDAGKPFVRFLSSTAGLCCGGAVPPGTKFIYKLRSPLTGDVVEVNPALDMEPELVLTDPYGEGWLLRMRPAALDEEKETLLLVKGTGAAE